METRPTSEAFEAAVRIVGRLTDAGYVAYLAGGCVRDVLLGREPKDYDVATDAKPQTVQSLFKRTQAVGEAFGVVLVRSGSRERPVQTEVATFRREWAYADGRRPDHIAYTDAEHDAWRRDFTVNALFADVRPGSESRGQRPGSNVHGPDWEGQARGQRERADCLAVAGFGLVIDFVGGLADLKARLVRAVGKPEQRFGEDYLRMLRAVRFAAKLEFSIEPATAWAIGPLAWQLAQISRERIGDELEQMLSAPGRVEAIGQTQALGLDAAVLDEPHADSNLVTLGQLTFDDVEKDSIYPLALAGWMLDRHGLGKVDRQPMPRSNALDAAAEFAEDHAGPTVKGWRRALCLRNQTTQRLRATLAGLTQAKAWPDLGIAARKRTLAQPSLRLTLALVRALAPERAAMIQRESAPLREEGICPPPLVNGQDLIGLGFEPGPAFRTRLEAAYDAQLEGRVRDRAEALDWLRQHA